MRILLFTGKGGVGKTTAAAGTACLAAGAGHRTLVMSTDTAHSLGDAFGARVGTEPTVVAPGLSVQHLDAQRRFEESWVEVRRYLLSVLEATGADPLTAEELTVLPGAEEVLALLELRRQVLSERWDVVVVDCAPTAETLRLLALPEALRWYMDRVFPAERRMMRALRPVLTRATGVPMPRDSVFAAVERLHSDLEAVQDLLTGKDCSVRLVLTPERVVLAEARRSFTTLSLFGYRVDGVLANRVFPGGGDPWQAGWLAAQEAVLTEVEQSFVGLPVWRSAYQGREPVGAEDLVRLAAAAYGDDDPLTLPTGESPMTLERTDSGATLRLALPLADRADVGLARHADELVVTVGSYRRVLTLPTALREHRVAGAGVRDGALRVRFAAPQDEPA